MFCRNIEVDNPLSRLKNNFFKTKVGGFLGSKLGGSRRFQPAMYTVFHEEPESEVQNTQILQGNLKISISYFHFFIF